MTRITGDWLDNASTQAVMAMLEDAGFQALAVGGCVRNALLGVPVSDVDIATDARPDRVMALAEAVGLKAVPTGIDHGTVTVVAEGEGHEITTFRADVETDGRRAVVRFSDDVTEDARRRDFTMNALYADARGHLVDPLGGLPDLHARRVRFIEDPLQRIHEDYLRILRFFRFTAWYGDPDKGFDPEALDAIAQSVDGLDALSRERVGHELRRLFAAPDPAPAAALMARTGVLAHVLPGADPAPLGPLVHAEDTLGLQPDPMRRLAVIGVGERHDLRLSKADQTRIALYQSLIGAAAKPAEIAYRHGPEIAFGAAALRLAVLGQELPGDLGAEIAKGKDARFPVRARDLMPGLSGPEIGETLRRLEARWIASGFALDRDDLLRLASE